MFARLQQREPTHFLAYEETANGFHGAVREKNKLHAYRLVPYFSHLYKEEAKSI